MPNQLFAELTKHVHLLNDLILSDMVCSSGDYAEESLSFSRRLFTMKYWFVRISWANKRKYILALLSNLRSAWALSLLLKSLWNCRPKDAIHSASKPPFLCVYDRAPMDHNRTALPISTLAQVMTADRKWFLMLEPEAQAHVLVELLTIAGGPIMWETLRRGQQIYEQYREQQLRDLLECIVVDNSKTPADSEIQKRFSSMTPEVGPSKLRVRRGSSSSRKIVINQSQTGIIEDSQKVLENNLAEWNTIMKRMRESQKLEELEMTFSDGTKKKIWKVHRTMPESYENVDFIQLLPSWIAMRIFGYLPSDEFPIYAKVNQYWAYLIEEVKTELATRTKLQAMIDKLKEDILQHDSSMEMIAQPVAYTADSVAESISPSVRRVMLAQHRASEKSWVSFRQLLVDRKRPLRSKPIKKVADLEERLILHGAADEKTWQWCKNVVRQTNKHYPEGKPYEGVLRLGDIHFPCPLMKQSLELPLKNCLNKDPSKRASVKPKNRGKFPTNSHLGAEGRAKGRRLSLWSRNFSSLYKVLKVASYQTPNYLIPKDDGASGDA